MWRLALDMGTNSLGWCAFELTADGEALALLESGVRIFSDGREPSGKDRVGDSLAVQRRLARGIRRNRDRANRRKKKLVERLVQLGLMPADRADRKALETLDPYALRAATVERPVTPHELGRALFQLGQRRGFLSNRKTDNDDEESGVIKPKISELRQLLGRRTLGQWLYERQCNGQSVRFRGQEGDLYADRAMYLSEFDAIRNIQREKHSLSEQDWDDLRNGNKAQGFDGIFFQRKLKPVERGRCEFFNDQYRAHKDLPIAHRFRILQDLGNLQYVGDDYSKYELNEAQRTRLQECLDNQKTITFGAIRKLKNGDGERLFPRDCLFNLEAGPKDVLKGNMTAVEMRKVDMLGDRWDSLDEERQNDLLEMLHEAEDDEQLIADLMGSFSLTAGQAAALCKFKLSPATTHLSRKLMSRCADIMDVRKLGYADAVGEVYDDDGVFLHHSQRGPDTLLDRLPYYGALLKGSVIGGKPDKYDAADFPEQHYGKINNPTVHVALNQLGKLVNRLSARFGAPDEIHLEIVRDLKKSAKARNDIAKENTKFAKANDRRADLFRDQNGGADPSGLDLKKIRLWEELGPDQLARRCPFSGRTISATMLFNGEAEIEHILPFARTLDNGTANLTVAIRQFNRLKGNNTPFEAFANGQHEHQGAVWSEIAERAKLLPRNKRWRFEAEAMDKFNKDGGFIARQLTDNAYISRLTKRYLGHICLDNKIVTIPGGLTAMMRGKWHLNNLIGDHNFKERNDHRHHIIDAFVVGLTDRGMLKRVSDQTKRGTDDRVHIDLPDISALRDQLARRLETIIVSYKPDHGTNGKMYKDTAYGLVAEEQQDPDLPGYTLVTRKKIESLSEKEVGAIRNPGWRTPIEQHVAAARASGTKLDKNGLAKVLGIFGQENNIKTIRILVSNQSATAISSAPYKAYAPDSFLCVDIWQLPKGKPGNWKNGEFEWQGAFWSYDQCGGKSPDKNDGLIKGKPIHPAARYITRLFKNDMIELDDGGQRKVMKVAGFSTTDNKIDLHPQYETDGKRQRLSINVLQKQFRKKLRIREDGSGGV